MERDIGDLIDRLAIAKLKSERIGATENKIELEEFEKGFKDFCDKKNKLIQEVLLSFFVVLYKLHSVMWDTEADLRKGSIDNDIVKTAYAAIIVRKQNAVRKSIRNTINILCGEKIIDITRGHLSE